MELISIEKLFCETDEDFMDIRDVYIGCSGREHETRRFCQKIAQNIHRIFHTLQAPKPFDPDEEED
ncbi:hypothetical protein [Petrimonas sp.]|uniref:hypothetical protein n=1 Tax=Petrimonas sp. TaxID=2023866 RepID=UPI003F514D70